jgi:hypothetical protein
VDKDQMICPLVNVRQVKLERHVLFRVRRSFGVRFRLFGLQSDTHTEGVGCTFLHTVQHINGRSWWGLGMFSVGGTLIVLGGNYDRL